MGCPSQWDAWDEDGNYYYLRYRHGWGEMRQYQTENWVDAPYPEGLELNFSNVYTSNTEYIRTIAEFQHGDPLDGFIELPEFCEHAGIELDLTMYTNYGEHVRDELVQEGLTFLLEPPTES